MFSRQQKIWDLRTRGFSYNEIAKSLGIAKSTVSYWLQGIDLPPSSQNKLQVMMKQAMERGLLASNKRKSELIQKENKNIKIESAKEIVRLSEKELFLVCIALYWGEGYQSERTGSYGIRFVNSNPNMIALFLRFLREALKIEDDKIKPHLNLHLNTNRNLAVNFWSKVTKLSPNKFVVTVAVSSASKGKRPVNSLPYGTLGLRVHNRRLFMKMKGWIEGLALQSTID